MLKKITVSAPGKLMLMGEHAVVYGHPCLSTAVSQRMKATVELTSEPELRIDAPDVGVRGYLKPIIRLGDGEIPKGARFVEAAVRNFITRHPVKSGIHISTSSEFSSLFGFGSSSASAVCVTRALSELTGAGWDDRTVFDTAYRTVLDIQGRGSGFDVASAVYGGTIRYAGAYKVIEPLRLGKLPLVIGYSGTKADSVTLLNQVAANRVKFPVKVDRIFVAIGNLVDQAQPEMVAGNWERVGKLMGFNQEYLRDLGVSTTKIEDLISAAGNAGAYGAKLSGAGGGDCMIAVVPPEAVQAVRTAITRAGGTPMDVMPGAPGVMTETTDNPEELFVVVDPDDKIIGYRTRYDCHHDPSLLHRSVAVAVYDRQGRMLFSRRSRSKDTDPGLWEISASGHVARGESYMQAATRELKEELGLELPLTEAGKFIYESPVEREINKAYRTVSDGPVKTDGKETDRVMWIGRGELPRLLLSGKIILTGYALQALKLLNFI